MTKFFDDDNDGFNDNYDDNFGNFDDNYDKRKVGNSLVELVCCVALERC